MMEKTLVIFDVDGTLVFSNHLDSQCFALTYEQRYKRPFPGIDWTKYPHVTDHTIFNSVIRQHFEREATELEIDEFQMQYINLLQHNRRFRPAEFKEVPAARTTINKLRNDGRFIVGVATGGWQRPACIKLNHVNIPAGELLISGADGKETREEIIEQVIRIAGEQFPCIHRIVYIGDAIWDVETTRRMNMNFVGIRRLGDIEVLKKAGCAVVLQDYTDYGRFVEALFETVPPVNF